MNVFTKHPEEILDYKFDFTKFLSTGETITSRTVTVEAGLNKDADTFNSTSVTVWLSGGTAGNRYLVTCKVNTNQGRTKVETAVIKVEAG